MSYVTETLSNLIHQTAFFNLTWGNYLMIAVACVFLFLAIKKGFEPLLLVPIAFGMLLVNIYPDIMANPEDMSNGVGGLLHYFYLLDEWSILPRVSFLEQLHSLVFMLHISLQSFLDSTEKQQQPFPSSVEQMALPLFSSQENLDRLL